MWNISTIKRDALHRLSGFFWKAVLVMIIHMVILNILTGILPMPNLKAMMEYPEEAMRIISQNIVEYSTMYMKVLAGTFIIRVFAVAPLEVGLRRFFMKATDGEVKTGELFFAFKNNYLNVVKIMFLRDLFIYLWSLLFVIPGLVKSFQLYFVARILAEKPDISYREAAAKSKEMTNGDKLHILGLNLSFIGWMFLGMMVMGVGTVVVYPYMYEADEMLYRTKNIDTDSREYFYNLFHSI